MIERRWTSRAPVNLDVEVLCHHGAGMAACKALDIGLGGVFLKINPDEILPDSNVELFFLLGEGESRIKHKIKAKIVRTTMHGLGLMFRDFDATAFRSLQEVLHYYKDTKTQ